MKRLSLIIMCAALAALGCGGGATETAPETEVVVEQALAPAPAEEAVAEVRHDLIYTCGCGPECECGAVSATAGKCDCGSELVQAHLLKVEGDEGLVCGCESGCTCDIDAEDNTKCGCGKDVKRVSFEGKGIYYCNCGGSCTCKYVAAEAGKCACGMDLVTS